MAPLHEFIFLVCVGVSVGVGVVHGGLHRWLCLFGSATSWGWGRVIGPVF